MIYTVNGPIEKIALGITLGHEHFKWETDEDYANQMYFDKVYNEEASALAYQQLMPLMKSLYESSCRAIVEASPPIGGENIKLLRRLSIDSGIHIIPCTGWNMNKNLYYVFKEYFSKSLSERWVEDFEKGMDTIDGVVIKPAYIKLLISRGALSKPDEAMLIAAVMASKQTGMPIHCHILESETVLEVIALLEREEAVFSKFLWAHADEVNDLETIKIASEKGLWLGIDNVREGTHENRCELLKSIIEMGYGERVILSQDYDFFDEVTSKGEETPCTSLLNNFIPYCMNQGMEKVWLDKFLIDNPATFYDI